MSGFGLKAFLAAAALALGGAAAHAAQPAPPAAQAAREPGTAAAACAPLFKDPPYVVRNRLFGFEVVYGKKAMLWVQEDYERIVALAASCNGVKGPDGTAVDARNWFAMISAARDKVLPIAELARSVAEYGQNLKPEQVRLPDCPALITFKLDYFKQSDNSQEMFGRDFLAMGDADLERVILYTNQCLVYLPQFLTLSRGWNREQTVEAVNRVMDRALLVQKRRQDWAAQERRETDLVVDVEGVVVPPTMTQPLTREMIARFNKAAAQRRRFTPETISILVRDSDAIADRVNPLSKSYTQFDQLYVDAVKKRIQDEIFRGN